MLKFISKIDFIRVGIRKKENLKMAEKLRAEETKCQTELRGQIQLLNDTWDPRVKRLNFGSTCHSVLRFELNFLLTRRIEMKFVEFKKKFRVY